MFYIDAFNKEEVTLEDAVKLINSGNPEASLLDNMLAMEMRLSIQQSVDEDNFCDDWCYEINAYNKVYSEMSQLFA